MMSSPIIEVKSLQKYIAQLPILRDVTFSLQAGEFALLLGHNGAGKTTLLRLLSGLTHPSGGGLWFRGEPFPQALLALRGALGVISHESRLYEDLTARENLRLFGTLQGIAELVPRIEAALERVGLGDIPEIPVGTFSSGMVKRVAIARLMVHRPALLLLDEPYSGLDQATGALFDAYLAEVRSEGGAICLTTHQFTNSLELCDRILILQAGSLVYNRVEVQPSVERCAQLLVEYGARSRAGPVPTNPGLDVDPP